MNDIDLTALYDDSKSLNEGALTVPGFSMDGWYGRIFGGSGYFDMDKPIRRYGKKELHDLLHREPTKIKVDGINLTYEGLVAALQRSMLSKDVDSLQPHVRAFVERAVTFTTCPECEGTRLAEGARTSKVAGISIADACAMQVSDLTPGRPGSTSRRSRRCCHAAARARLVRRDRARLPRRSTARPARCPAARPSAPRWSGTWARR